MKLYYATGACSLAPHIALEEIGLRYEAVPVDLKAKTVRGGDYRKINPKGAVPALELDSGEILTENAVVLQYIADQRPEAGLLPKGGLERYRALEWLNFIATELHKGFGPLWKPTTPDAYKAIVIENLGKRFDYIAPILARQPFIAGDAFTIADAYLFTILNWTNVLKVDLARWPSLTQYLDRIAARSGVRKALQEEHLLKAAA